MHIGKRFDVQRMQSPADEVMFWCFFYFALMTILESLLNDLFSVVH